MANNGYGDHYVMNHVKGENHGKIVITVHYSNNKVIWSYCQDTLSYNFFHSMLVPLEIAAEIPLETEMLSFIALLQCSFSAHRLQKPWLEPLLVAGELTNASHHIQEAPGSAPRAYRPKAAG